MLQCPIAGDATGCIERDVKLPITYSRRLLRHRGRQCVWYAYTHMSPNVVIIAAISYNRPRHLKTYFNAIVVSFSLSSTHHKHLMTMTIYACTLPPLLAPGLLRYATVPHGIYVRRTLCVAPQSGVMSAIYRAGNMPDRHTDMAAVHAQTERKDTSARVIEFPLKHAVV